jgi:hypothetical protein
MNEARDYELLLLSRGALPNTSTSTVNDDDRPASNTVVDGPATDEKNRVLTFAELKELIESGNVDKIPNNKIIPETLNVRFVLFLEGI